MTDNSSLPVASGNETFANDDIGGVKYPRPKMGWGPDGTYNDTDVASGKPFPVQLRGSDGTDRSNSLPVVATNAGTFATQVDGAALTALQLIDDPVATLGTTTYTEASTKGMIAGAVRRDANTSLVDTTNEVAPLQVNATGELKVAQIQALPAGTNNIGDVDVLTVPTDPFGANADAASATGSISAKLRGIATALGVTALDLGSGTGGSRTIRTTLDTASAGILPTVTSDQASNYAAPALRTVPQEVHVGEVGGKTAVVSVTLSTDTSAYASGDLIADTQQIDAFFRKVNGTGVINSINIIDEDAQGVALYVIFMSTSTSLGTENSAPNISDANLTAGFQGIVSVATSDYVTLSGAKVATIKNIGLPVKAVSGTDDLYIAVLNATGTPTFTAAGLEMRIGVLLD